VSSKAPLTKPGVGEPPGRPGHPYVNAAPSMTNMGSGTTPGPANAPYPRLPEAPAKTVPKGGAVLPKGEPPQPAK
jgi:hypothetical protein